MSDGLDIRVATASERPALENLLQFYIHDFSELFAGTLRCDVESDGRYRSDIPLANWWSLVDHLPLLLRVNDKLAGFVLLNATAHSGAAVDRNIAEFFVVRKYRRRGMGRVAAHTLFNRYPGRWEAAVMRANTNALHFWEQTISSHPRVHDLEIADHADQHWNGTIFRFAIAPA